MKKLLASILLLLPVSAFAHAFPVAYSPDGFSLNPTMPSEVMICFSQGILATGNGIEVFAPDGTKLPPADAEVDMHGEHVLSRSVTLRGKGIYVVSWHGVSSEDGHFTKGAFSFFVGATSSAPSFYGGSADAEVAVRRDVFKDTIPVFLVFLALSILIGSLVFLFLLRREKSLNDQMYAQFFVFTHRSVFLALLVLFVGVALSIVLKVQFPFIKPSGLLAAVTLFSDSITVLALLLWVGSILVFTVLYLPMIDSQAVLAPLRVPLRVIFGRISAYMLLLGGTGGAWSVWMHLKSEDNLMTTAWGSALITLLLLLGFMLLLRCFSLFFLERTKRCIHCEWAYTLLESGVSLCVLFSVALISITPSPVYNSPLWSVVRMDASRMITVTDLDDGEDALRLRAYDAKGAPITASLPTVLLDNAKEGIGPLVIPVKDRGEGNYDIPEALLTPSGEWRIAITFKPKSTYDINATIGIDYPREIRASRIKAQTPHFGTFEILLFSIVLVMLVLCFVMLFFIKRNNAFVLLHPEYDMDQRSIGAVKAIAVAFTAFLLVIAMIVMLRMMLPFYSEKTPDSKIIPAHMDMKKMLHDMSEM